MPISDEPHQDVYFIGIALPPELDKLVSDLKWQLHDTHPAALKPLLPHVTLLNPPSLKGIMPSELIPKVREIAQKYLPLTLSLEEVGMFGKRVCVIRVQSQELYSLQAQLMKLLPPEARELHYKYPYSPHVTMLQVYDPAAIDGKETAGLIAQSISLPQQFIVDSVACFTRILPREYRAEAV